MKDIRGNAYLYSSKTETLRDLDAGGGHLSLTVVLFGDYDSVQAFAQDCRRVTDAVQQCSALPDELRIAWAPDNDPGQSLTAGTLQRVEQYTLELDGIAQRSRWQSRRRYSTCWTKKTKKRQSPKMLPWKARS